MSLFHGPWLTRYHTPLGWYFPHEYYWKHLIRKLQSCCVIPLADVCRLHGWCKITRTMKNRHTEEIRQPCQQYVPSRVENSYLLQAIAWRSIPDLILYDTVQCNTSTAPQGTALQSVIFHHVPTASHWLLRYGVLVRRYSALSGFSVGGTVTLKKLAIASRSWQEAWFSVKQPYVIIARKTPDGHNYEMILCLFFYRA